MFEALEHIHSRPRPFEFCTVRDLWTDEHISGKMLEFHLDENVDAASRSTAFIDRSVEWIASQFHVGMGTKIADFGCGPGLYVIRLAKKQADVIGIDFSQRSIRYARDWARRERLSIQLVNQDYLEYETEDRFDLAMMIFCDFCALSPSQRERMLGKFHAILKPGGAVLFDVCSLAAFERRKETAMYAANLMDGFWSPDKYYGFLNTFKYEAEKVTLDQYTLIEATRTRTVYNWLQYFSQETLQRELEACGLAVEAFYGDVAGAPFDPEADEFAAVARRV